MKRKVLSEEELQDLILPGEGQVFGMAVKMYGYDRILVNCEDGKERLCRIVGKLKRRVWIRVGDLVLVSPWEFDSKRGDIVWRYMKNQRYWLKKKGYVKLNI
ncbi:translation initiation factor eIF-1A [Candidatus Hecatella orcuttiae]|uniref:translation initiation factor eIF-1A n=1 Tax=Candidatus Hecatella orcuttiae TaxID=1935119 RepID=UPI002867FA47|nr:translation initiation factor eIF-1A [Candidatus Hecatella orcuttiae]